MTTRNDRTVWIGLVEIATRPAQPSPLIGDAKGGFCKMLAWARNVEEFKEQVTKALNHYHLDFVDMEEVEPFADRENRIPMGKVLHRTAEEVEVTKMVRFFKTIHTFDNEE